MSFDGFPADTARFLAGLARNNNRPWFQANRDRYDRSVRAPALAFIEAMAAPLARISRFICADSSPVGGSLMRIYRDTRFSPDKQPYKTNIGIQFRHVRGRDAHAPAFYLHIDPKERFLGAGCWRPDSAALAAIRTRIVEHPDEWRQVRSARSLLRVWGGGLWEDRLKRPPRGVPQGHPCIEDLKLKSFIAIMDLPPDQVHSPGLVQFSAKAFAAASPLMKFLCAALELSY